jgi:hypothetical protein
VNEYINKNNNTMKKKFYPSLEEFLTEAGTQPAVKPETKPVTTPTTTPRKRENPIHTPFRRDKPSVEPGPKAKAKPGKLGKNEVKVLNRIYNEAGPETEEIIKKKYK